jgi:hypothetical protein
MQQYLIDISQKAGFEQAGCLFHKHQAETEQNEYILTHNDLLLDKFS